MTLMRFSEGGITGDFIMDMDVDDFLEALEAAEELAKELGR